MKKAVVLTMMLFSICLMAYGQESEARFRKSVMLNINIQNGDGNFSISQLAPVFILTNRHHNTHAFEINSLGYDRDKEKGKDGRGLSYESVSVNSSFGLRYQYTHYFWPEKSLVPFIGSSFQTVWHTLFFDPNFDVIKSDQSRLLSSNNSLELVPGIKYQINSTTGIRLSFILPVVSYEYKYFEDYNNVFSIDQRLDDEHNHNFYYKPFEHFHSRLGFYVNL